MENVETLEIIKRKRVALLHHAHIEAMKQIIEQQQPFKLSVNGALSLRDLAKIKMEESDYNDFMYIMLHYKESNTSDVLGTLTKFYSILKNYPEVKQAFGMFLPPHINLKFQTGYYVSTDDNSSNKELESEMLSEVKLDSNRLHSGSKDNQSVRNKVTMADVSSFRMKIKERFENPEEVYQKINSMLPSLSESLKADAIKETQVFLEFCEMFHEHDDLIEDFKKFVPNADYSYQKQNVKEVPLPNFENESDTEDSDDINEVKDPSIANVYKYGSYKEHKFFDKVKAALVYKEVYDNFLRCINLYNEDIVTNVELVKVCTSFLGRHPELLKELKDMLGFEENGENYEIIPMKIVNMESRRSDPEIALDIDYATDGRNGASYRALPKQSEQPICSGRTPLCKQVLNDTWVSFPSWSEDSTFVTSCKTQYEEIMYRCEDERFEMDMAIQSNAYAIQLLESVQKKINKMHTDDKTVMVLDDTLGGTSAVLYQRALHW